jgi:hypothetical protein
MTTPIDASRRARIHPGFAIARALFPVTPSRPAAQLVPARRRTTIMKFFFMAACMAKQAAP